MSLTTEFQEKIYKSLDDAYGQVKFFQDQVVLLDNDKSGWDQAIFKIDSQLFGDIQIVNKALDEVKDAYQEHFTGVTSCRSDLFYVAYNYDSQDPENYNFACAKLNPNGYTDLMAQLKRSFPTGNLVGVGSTFFYYLNPATGILTTSPTNAVTGAEQGTTDSFTHDENTFRFGFDPKNYYGLKYYVEPYQLDIGDTFVTSFIGTITAGSNQLTVMSPVGSTGQDPSVTPIYKTGQIVTCDKDGVLTTPTKITGINTGTADLAQIPTTGAAGVVTTNVSTVNILSVNPVAGLAVSAFDSVSFSILDNPTTGPVGVISDVTSNGEVYKENEKYHAVPSTSNFSGEGATFSVFTNASGGIATVGISTTTGGVAIDIIGAGGLGYANGDTITIAGTSLLKKTGVAGSTADNLTFTVKSIQEGRFRFGFILHEDPTFWPKPTDPQTVGIMQTSNLGIGGRISLDNSGDPRGSQSWDPNLENEFLPMDPTNFAILTKVVAPNVGADRSYWKVGFQTAPGTGGIGVKAVEGSTITNIEEDDFDTYLITLPSCSASSNTKISDAISVLTPLENSFVGDDARNKTMVDATNALRQERNELCMRIWGNRTAIGDLNNQITRLESLRGYIEDETIEDIIG